MPSRLQSRGIDSVAESQKEKKQNRKFRTVEVREYHKMWFHMLGREGRGISLSPKKYSPYLAVSDRVYAFFSNNYYIRKKIQRHISPV